MEENEFSQSCNCSSVPHNYCSKKTQPRQSTAQGLKQHPAATSATLHRCSIDLQLLQNSATSFGGRIIGEATATDTGDHAAHMATSPSKSQRRRSLLARRRASIRWWRRSSPKHGQRTTETSPACSHQWIHSCWTPVGSCGRLGQGWARDAAAMDLSRFQLSSQ